MSSMINVRLPVRMFVRPITPPSTPLVHIPILPKSGAHTRNYLDPTHCYPRCDTYINLPRYIHIRLNLPLGAIRSSRGPFRVSLASGLLTRVCGNFGVTRVLHGVPFFLGGDSDGAGGAPTSVVAVAWTQTQIHAWGSAGWGLKMR